MTMATTTTNEVRTPRQLEIEGIAHAIAILEEKRGELRKAPNAIYAMVMHAQDKLNDRIARMLRGDD